MFDYTFLPFPKQFRDEVHIGFHQMEEILAIPKSEN